MNKYICSCEHYPSTALHMKGLLNDMLSCKLVNRYIYDGFTQLLDGLQPKMNKIDVILNNEISHLFLYIFNYVEPNYNKDESFKNKKLLEKDIILSIFVKNYPAYFVPKENIFKSLSEGIQFVFKSRMILGALSLDMFSVFFGGAVALMPIFAHDILKVGAEGLGFMRAAPAFGAVITMFILAKYPPMNKPWRNLLLAVAGFGISIICFGLSRNFYLTLLCLFFEGAFDSVSVIIRSTLP
jgi:hypothetical protein